MLVPQLRQLVDPMKLNQMKLIKQTQQTIKHYKIKCSLIMKSQTTPHASNNNFNNMRNKVLFDNKNKIINKNKILLNKFTFRNIFKILNKFNLSRIT